MPKYYPDPNWEVLSPDLPIRREKFEMLSKIWRDDHEGTAIALWMLIERAIEMEIKTKGKFSKLFWDKI